MAERKIEQRHMVAASSLLEVLVSMVVILVVFGIAMMIYGNITRFSLSAKKLRAGALLQEMLVHPRELLSSDSSTMMTDSIFIEKSIGPGSGVREIRLKAFDTNHRLLAEARKIIPQP